MSTAGVTALIAGNIARTTYEDLSPQTVQVTKKSILDCLGAMLAATTLGEGCREIAEIVAQGDGRGESTIIGYGGRAPAPMAAFANGSLTHPLDYDDIDDFSRLHPTGSCLPASFAIAERLGGVDGKRFITALALGNDLVVRLGSSLQDHNQGWSRPPIIGVFGATAAAAKLLGLDEGQMAGALGMALNQAAGSWEGHVGAGSVFRGIRDAFSAKGGVMAALMAQKGLIGGKQAFEGKAGLFNLYFRGHYDPARLVDRVGERFEGAGLSFKPWPSCRVIHTFADATLRLVREHDIRPEQVKGIKLTVGSDGRSRCLPAEQKRRPQLAIDALFSLPYCVAVAVQRRNLVLGDFSAEALRDPQVLDVAQKVTWKYDKSYNRRLVEAATVEIASNGGQSYSQHVDIAYGHPDNPISDADLQAKFRDCAAYSVKPLSKATVDKVIRTVSDLETAPDVVPLVRLLA
ncbi:MAG: MmgE/PrpD family protein [Chloroflexi bacterium]|nr:MmgE/PrpD family protein [Chloroflexota bacterium]